MSLLLFKKAATFKDCKRSQYFTMHGNKKIDLLKRDHKVMAEKEIDWTLANANRYFDMIDKIKKVKK